jgi:hypothetical protein
MRFARLGIFAVLTLSTSLAFGAGHTMHLTSRGTGSIRSASAVNGADTGLETREGP